MHQHVVACRSCHCEFDLFAADWCEHGSEPSKVCPACRTCFCGLPSYREPALWKAAPLIFRQQGFERIFVEYL